MRLRTLMLLIVSVSVAASVCLLPVTAQISKKPDVALLHGTGASALLQDVVTGRVAGHVGDIESEAAPGSAVKPFVLRTALESGLITEHATVHCEGVLQVAGHNLACVHARDVTVLDARQALAESCNAYFAAVARRMSFEQMAAALRGAGFRVKPDLGDVTARELTGLGLKNSRISVRQMAEAYRKLALWMQSGSSAAQVVRDGLISSVNTGVAHAAYVPGLAVAGKTGTVDLAGTGRSEGWFAGILYGAHGEPEWVLVVHVPNGNGRDAAALARRAMVAR